MPDDVRRDVLPIPDAQHVGLTTYDAKDPNTSYPPITMLRPPEGAPNVLIVLIDDVGFGASSAFGGPCNTPGCRATRFGRVEAQPVSYHRIVLAHPPGSAHRPQPPLGRHGCHYRDGDPRRLGNNSIRPKNKAPIADTLRLNGY